MKPSSKRFVGDQDDGSVCTAQPSACNRRAEMMGARNGQISKSSASNNCLSSECDRTPEPCRPEAKQVTDMKVQKMMRCIEGVRYDVQQLQKLCETLIEKVDAVIGSHPNFDACRLS